ncbi:hypothetical protein C8J56DRAFT_170498 [Mycena floridula]|nr:hypothetical protein C8J56DRAFT_170498 [Mycena floridula]
MQIFCFPMLQILQLLASVDQVAMPNVFLDKLTRGRLAILEKLFRGHRLPNRRLMSRIIGYHSYRFLGPPATSTASTFQNRFCSSFSCRARITRIDVS